MEVKCFWCGVEIGIGPLCNPCTKKWADADGGCLAVSCYRTADKNEPDFGLCKQHHIVWLEDRRRENRVHLRRWLSLADSIDMAASDLRAIAERWKQC